MAEVRLTRAGILQARQKQALGQGAPARGFRLCKPVLDSAAMGTARSPSLKDLPKLLHQACLGEPMDLLALALGDIFSQPAHPPPWLLLKGGLVCSVSIYLLSEFH